MEATTEDRQSPSSTQRHQPRVKAYSRIVTNAEEGRSESRSRQSRRIVFVGIISLILIQALLNLGIRNNIVPVQDPVFEEKIELYRHWQTTGDTHLTRVVSLGSSRTQLAFDAECYSHHSGVNAFNFGVSAAGPLTSSLYFRRLLQELGPKPDVLFVEIHPGFWSPIDPPFESRWLHSYRLRPEEVELLHQYGWNAPSPAQHGWKGWCASAYCYRFALLNRYAPRLLPCPFGLTVGARSDERGFVGGIDLPEDDRPRALQMSYEQYAPAFPNYTVGGAGPAATRDILTQAKQHGIRTALVLMPESSEFRSWYGHSGYSDITRQAEQLSQQFSSPLYDAREWLTDDLIADGHHLSTTGAKLYSEKLADKTASWLNAPEHPNQRPGR